MYKATVRALVRKGIGDLNRGRPELLLRLASRNAVICFPGDNSWAAMHRPVEKGRTAHATHQGIEECRSFADRFVAEGLRFRIEDILVNGPPWKTRVVVLAHDYIEGPEGIDRYNNRVAAAMTIRWGKLTRWEDFEDTERIAAWDAEQRTPPVSAG